MSNLIGSGINQISVNGMLGNLAFQDKAYVSVDAIGIGTTFVDSGTVGQVLQVSGGAYVSGNLGVGTTNPQSQLHITGQFQSTQANSTTTGGGQIYLNGATGNRIDFGIAGAAAPAFTTRSAGTKIVLYPNVSGSSVDIGFGIDVSTLWSSVFDSTSQFKWYAGITTVATLKGTGEFLLGIGNSTGTTNQKLQVTGDAYVSGNLGIGTTNPSQTLHIQGNTRITGALFASDVSGVSTSGASGQVLQSVGTGISWVTFGGGATLTNDTTTNATYYPTFSSATSGTYSTAYVSNTKCTFNPSTGTLSATQFTSLSDETQKTDIKPIENAIGIVKQLQGVKYKWIDNQNQPSIGVIAQEIEKVLPEVVSTNEDGLKSVSYGNIIGLLIEAIKEQQIRIEELERKN